MGSIGFTEFLLIGIVLLLLFGPKKLPELGRAFGKTLREFKNGARNMMEEDTVTTTPAPATAPIQQVAAQTEYVAAPAAQSAQASEARVRTPDSRRLPD
ncbi:twin-arginine translocase TatA/TatE family subunit [Paenibacillus sp. N1-5-1-14]|uniref:twin-arginine translocase TatA/TatE family subunit n=1 Tax=Paenibacillus radicibacter TaxID=2972488 RepID=UPI002158B4FC|nr:twin-arginine translocase TatA/TatE family subunit [Paenibacillus radicibacter]MCR8643594.1 twin-arginine translocase TatA/TatE family subunit [Paenibacillus radicibacter]